MNDDTPPTIEALTGEIALVPGDFVRLITTDQWNGIEGRFAGEEDGLARIVLGGVVLLATPQQLAFVAGRPDRDRWTSSFIIPYTT